MSRIPGMAVATTSRAPDDTSRFEILFMPWSARYSSRASSGVMRRARTDPPARHRLQAGQERLVVGEGAGPAERGRDPRLALELHHQDRQAGVGRHPGQSGGDGGLAHPALARDHEDPALAAEGGDVHVRASVSGRSPSP